MTSTQKTYAIDAHNVANERHTLVPEQYLYWEWGQPGFDLFDFSSGGFPLEALDAGTKYVLSSFYIINCYGTIMELFFRN